MNTSVITLMHQLLDDIQENGMSSGAIDKLLGHMKACNAIGQHDGYACAACCRSVLEEMKKRDIIKLADDKP